VQFMPSHTILVVDDVPERLADIEEEVHFSLCDLDIEVLKASDIPEAERIFAENPGLEAVVLDLQLPAIPEAPTEGGLYLLKKFAQCAPEKVYILSSGTPPEQGQATQDLPIFLEHLYVIPKTDPRHRLIDCLRLAIKGQLTATV
jgi:CheY-like chemotaxis protein